MAQALPSLGRYVVLRELGSGGMARVYLARDPNLNRHVAIKVILADRLEDRNVVDRFFAEARIAARLKNPHIIEIYDFGDDGGIPYIVMEFINGPTLEEVITKLLPDPIPQEIVAALICQVAEGLDIASQKDIVHRDIKPANLMVTQQGYLKIMDFGIAHLKNLSITRTNGIIGPPAFMSPEQINGIKPLTIQSDMFALGTLFYFCLTGQHPFMEDSYGGVFARVLHETPPPVSKLTPGIDPHLEWLVKTLLEKEPQKRGKGPKWLQRELQDFLHNRKVVGPVDRVSRFLEELNSKGFTTTRLSPSEIERAAKSFRGKTSRSSAAPRRRNIRSLWARAGLGLALLLVLSALGVGAWYGWSLSTEPAPHLAQVSRQSPSNVAGAREPAPAMPKTPPPVVSVAPDSAASQAGPTKTTKRGGSTSSILKENKKRKGILQARATARPVEPLPVETIEGDCSLGMKTSPPFAEIYLDGILLGTSPINNAVAPCGRHWLTMKAPSGETKDTLVYFPGGRAQLRISLSSSP